MDKTVLLTRPLLAAKQDARLWQQAEFKTIIAPLLKIEFTPQIPPDLKAYQAVIVTSGMAIRALSILTKDRDFPLWCVGKSSATLAKSLGFQKIFTPSLREAENATALLTGLIRTLNPKGGPLFYAVGEFVHLDLSDPLRKQGYEIEKRVLYDAQPDRASQPTIQKFFEKPVVGGATFYSHRTALSFKEMINSLPDLEIRGKCYPLCFSSSIAEIIQPFFYCSPIIASTTSQLIANLKKITRSG